MAYWQPNSITNINIGTNPNDGTGDDIRTSFDKVDNNLGNISAFLGGTNVDFLGANIGFNLAAQFGNITNFFTPNANATNSNITSNVTAANVISTTGLYSQGQSFFYGNLNVNAPIVPTGTGLYDLGSPTNRFRTIYSQSTDAATQIQSSSDAGLLLVHANANPGDQQDTGILGNITSDYAGANTYAFFGHQYTTNNFVYKITNTNAVLGNNIVYDGIYGNAQLGSLFLSNSTISNSTSSGALIVAGGAGIGGNLTVAGNVNVTANITSGGYQIVTTNTPGISLYSGISAFNAPVTITASNPSSSTSTGALVLSFGGLGVAGNAHVGANVVAGAVVGPYYGTIQTANQPNITGLGAVGNLTVTYALNAGSMQTTTLGVTNITATGNVNVSTINGLVGLQVSGNTTSTGFVGNFYGTLQIAAQPNITSVGTLTSLTVAGTVTTPQVNGNVQGTILTVAQPNITSVGTLANLSTAAIYTNNYRFANGTPYVTTSIANTTEISANVPNGGSVGLSLIATGVTAGTYGSATNIPTFVVDTKGRISSAANVAISTSLATSGTSGTGSVSLLSQTLAVNGGTDISTTASGQTITVNDTSTLATVTGRGATTSTALTLNGQINLGANIVPSANVTYNLGSPTAWFNTFYGKSTQAQYADLAENYQADSVYLPGTVVVFGGDAEITVTDNFSDTRVAGVVSTNPAYLMNADAPDGLAIALRGRVPCFVTGPVTKGDLLVTADGQPGQAVSVGKDKTHGASIFGKALETDLTAGPKVIEVVIL